MKKRILLLILALLMLLSGAGIAGCGRAVLVISNVSVTDITDSSATITWTTNLPATSRVQYGTTTNYQVMTEHDATLVTDHSMVIDRLTSEMIYHFVVKSIDAEYVLATSDDATFTTAVDATPNQTAVIVTSMGTIKFELYENRAPFTTANFIGLAEDGFYDGLIFHRVIDDFMIQGGDPEGDGTGGSEITIDLELHPELTHVDGAVSMARSSDPNSASSQFFICDGPQVHLNGSYAVFGLVTEGIEVVRNIATVETNASDKPLTDVVMISVSIE